MAGEHVLESERPYEGRIVSVRVDTVRFQDGSEHKREVVEHPGAVAILPVLPSGNLVLVKQYRHAVDRSLLEVPAGTREPGEPVEATALRELAEETGYVADTVSELVRFLVSPGWADEELVVFVAKNVQPGTAQPEADEDIEVIEVQPTDVPGLISRGEIADSKTMIAMFAWLGIQIRVS